MPPSKIYEDMTADELDAEIIEMNKDLDVRRQAILRVHAIYDQKRSVENALRRLDGLSDAEMEALLVHVNANKANAEGEE